jgi:hypothetical protein
MNRMGECYRELENASDRMSSGTPPEDKQLSGIETVFRSLPFTPEMVNAIRLIAPHFEFAADEESRHVWEKDQNSSCWNEYEALAPVLGRLPIPPKVLEIGPGLGRSVVFFNQKLGWKSTAVHLYEGDGHSTKYTLLGPRFRYSFCGNIKVLTDTLEYNAVRNVTVFDARRWKLIDLPGPYDLVYSFYSIGFHWSLEYFLDDIAALMHQKTIAIFTVPESFAGFPDLEKFSHRVIGLKAVWPKHARFRLLMLSKEPLP